MKKTSWIIILAALLIFLGIFNHAVYKKERLIDQGQPILMELAPVDPRSLIQGDYMRLDYRLGQEMAQDSLPAKGLCALEIDARGVAQNIRHIQNPGELGGGEILIKYSTRGRRGMHFGAESYFFQEWTGEKYEVAKYGGIKVDEKGNCILIGLYDENLHKIE